MRCKACDSPLSDNQQWFFTPAGTHLVVPETLCTKCLSHIRPARVDRTDDDDNPVALILGTRYVESPPPIE
jgi:hypothetical protein